MPRKSSTASVQLTDGPIGRRILSFALPLFLGNLFQQLYNAADSLVVGNFIGDEALAAVSSSSSLIFMLVGFFNGIAVGAGVVIARFIGAQDEEGVERAVHTNVAFGLAAGLALTLIGTLLTPQILAWMKTPADVMPSSVLYLRIYFCGSISFVLYNILVGILQSSGDSRTPLTYLIISSVANVALDLLFVVVFRLGVGSAAVATILAQTLNAALCLQRLLRTRESYRLRLRCIRFDGPMLSLIIRNGLPTGVQNSITALANVVVQSNINVFGKMAVAGCGSYSKIEGFGFLPINCFSMALTTFISQNLGAEKYDRVRRGARFGILCSVTMAELVGIAISLLAPALISLFNSDPGVVQYGVMQARTVTLFYFLLAFTHCLAAIFRGGGHSSVSMLVMLVCWCIVRVSYITVAVHFIPSIRVVFWAYPLTWLLSSIIFLIFYWRSPWLHRDEKPIKNSL